MRLLTSFIILLFSFQVFTQSTIENSIDSLFVQYDTQSAGASILVTQGNNILYKKDFGQDNLEYGTPISSSTIFNAASLSKQFVAFGIYLLEKEGKLSINDNVHDFVPELPHYSHSIKINNLLTHTSGIRDQWGLLDLAGYRMDDFISHEAVLNLILSQKELNFESGTQFEYSHSNYTLLAQVIESATGMGLNEYLKESIFDPLKMNKTFFLDSSTKIFKDRAYSYEEIDGAYTKVNLNYQNYGPTNLMTTVDDLSKWASNFSSHVVGSKALIGDFDDIGKLSNGNEIIAADLGEEKIMGCKGQFYRNYKGLNFYSHGGSIGGFRSFLGRIPDEDLSIIILGNVSSLNTYSTALKIVDIILELKDNPKKEEELKDVVKEEKEESILINPEQYIGDFYNREVNSYIQISFESGELKMLIGRKKVDDFTYVEIDEFMIYAMNAINMKFLRNDKHQIKGISASTLGVKEMFFEKLK